ncbi:uncharacterized protein LOC119326159 [Triticum dicoccoides]|uniref:uncharacterized protein LOC119326159 n=1 Tax=Triticum dicoccoides TaxID=85692 RepID=UPI001890C7C4|nr:uncharacterized protein LOC119326159 [Triticum dicoccoides]
MRDLFVLYRDPAHPPRLLVVQSRLRRGALLDSKLSEVLNLASSLEGSRDGFEHAESTTKGALPHLIAQSLRRAQPCRSAPVGRRSGATPAPTEYCLCYNLPR